MLYPVFRAERREEAMRVIKWMFIFVVVALVLLNLPGLIGNFLP
jgi:hypothetical protein